MAGARGATGPTATRTPSLLPCLPLTGESNGFDGTEGCGACRPQPRSMPCGLRSMYQPLWTSASPSAITGSNEAGNPTAPCTPGPAARTSPRSLCSSLWPLPPDGPHSLQHTAGAQPSDARRPAGTPPPHLQGSQEAGCRSRLTTGSQEAGAALVLPPHPQRPHSHHGPGQRLTRRPSTWGCTGSSSRLRCPRSTRPGRAAAPPAGPCRPCGPRPLLSPKTRMSTDCMPDSGWTPSKGTRQPRPTSTPTEAGGGNDGCSGSWLGVYQGPTQTRDLPRPGAAAACPLPSLRMPG